MELNEEHIAFENYFKQIIGLKLNKVEYAEGFLDGENPQRYYKTQYKNLDSVDFSIYFYSDSNDKIEFYWDSKFFDFGIGIKINENSNFTRFQVWNVSKTELWEKFIDSEITNVKLCWEKLITTKTNGETTFNFYPQDVQISFSNNKSVFISAAGFLEDDDIEVYGTLDNLTVTDDEDLARKVKMIN